MNHQGSRKLQLHLNVLSIKCLLCANMSSSINVAQSKGRKTFLLYQLRSCDSSFPSNLLCTVVQSLNFLSHKNKTIVFYVFLSRFDFFYEVYIRAGKKTSAMIKCPVVYFKINVHIYCLFCNKLVLYHSYSELFYFKYENTTI